MSQSLSLLLLLALASLSLQLEYCNNIQEQYNITKETCFEAPVETEGNECIFIIKEGVVKAINNIFRCFEIDPTESKEDIEKDLESLYDHVTYKAVKGIKSDETTYYSGTEHPTCDAMSQVIGAEEDECSNASEEGKLCCYAFADATKEGEETTPTTCFVNPGEEKMPETLQKIAAFFNESGYNLTSEVTGDCIAPGRSECNEVKPSEEEISIDDCAKKEVASEGNKCYRVTKEPLVNMKKTAYQCIEGDVESAESKEEMHKEFEAWKAEGYAYIKAENSSGIVAESERTEKTCENVFNVAEYTNVTFDECSQTKIEAEHDQKGFSCCFITAKVTLVTDNSTIEYSTCHYSNNTEEGMSAMISVIKGEIEQTHDYSHIDDLDISCPKEASGFIKAFVVVLAGLLAFLF